MIPISTELADQLKLLNPQQLAFLAGYAWAKSTGVDAAAVSFQPQADAAQPAPARRVRILSASQTGNARKVAEQLLAKLESAGVDAVLTAAADYKTKQLAEEDILLLVTSTQGEGEPPEEALPLHKFLNGKKAPDLSAVSFAVLGLGDSSYPKFCQAAADVWAWLQDGAHIYVCGDAARMARDVENALLDIIAEQGGMDRDDAEEYLNGLREDKRYQRDVY